MSFLPPLGGAGRGRGSANGSRGPDDASTDAAPEAEKELPHGLTRAEYHSGRRRAGPEGPRRARGQQPRQTAGSDSPRRGAPVAGQEGGLGRALGLTALGTLLPGAGLTATRYRVLGWVLTTTAVLAVVLLGSWVARNGALESALDVATRPGMLRGAALLLVLTGLAWAGTVVLTALDTRPASMTGTQRGLLAGFTAVMCVALAVPVAVGLWYIGAHTTAVDKIFTPSGDGAAATDRPNLSEDDPWVDMERVNVLLLGSDAGDNREGIRTDSMIVASVDTQTGDMVMFSIPRNLQNVPVPSSLPLAQQWPEGYNCGSECLMNGIWTAAEAHAGEHPELYPQGSEPGLVATKEVLSAVLGLPVHHTVIVNLAGFQELVDAMGGVEIDVQERVPMGGTNATDAQGNAYLVPGTESGWIEEGPQRLNGRQALWYARSRVTTDDFSRMRRQRCVVAAVVEQVNPLSMLRRYPAIAAAAGDNISVDIATEDLPAWAELVERVQAGTIESLPFTLENTNVVNPDFAKIRARVRKAIEPPEPPAATASPTPGAEATSTPEETPGPDEGPGQADKTTKEPTDELADVSAVC